MQINRSSIGAFFLGVLVMLLLALLTGAINRPMENVTGDTTISFRSVFASQDGRTVYVCDDDHVYRSTDGGSNWTVVLAKNSEGS